MDWSARLRSKAVLGMWSRANAIRESGNKGFYVTVQDTSPVIRLRDAFLGGRVQPFTLKCDLIDYDQRTGETDAQDFFTIRYYDIVSLYRKLLLSPLRPLNLWHHFLAYVNFTFEYPVGHPEITVFDHDVEWRHPNDHAFKGLLKVEVCMHINTIYFCACSGICRTSECDSISRGSST